MRATNHLMLAAVLVLAMTSGARAQVYQARPPTSQPYGKPITATAPAAAAGGAAATRAAAPSFTPAELEQIAAPIALYPDSLLAQVFMASTYPLEVVQADRWVKANPTLKDSPAELNKLTWDPSVKSLLNFPQVLAMMSEKLDWTLKLGDAFLADQKAMMDAVQRLRNKAYSQGNLKTTSEQNVKVQAAPTVAPTTTTVVQGQPSQTIVIESSSPSVVYVPTYNPTVVYGGWPYPSYPPYSYYPPGYVAGTALLSFGVGVACGAAWGNAWGGCNWNGGEVDVDINRNVNFNNNIDREKYKAERDARQTDRQGNRDTRQGNRQGGASSFQHDPAHRQGVSYRDSGTTEKFKGAGASQRTAQARESYRGRTESPGSMNRTGAGGASGFQNTGGAGNRTGSPSGSAARTNSSGSRSSGFGGVDSGGAGARSASNRGQSSRSSSSYSPNRSASPSRSSSGGGGSRSSGGGSRGGGGGGGGRGGGGGGRR